MLDKTVIPSSSSPLFFHLSFCEAPSYSSYLLHSPLFCHFASCFLSCEEYWRYVCNPGMGVLRLERAGAAQALPSQPQSWSCCTFGGSPQVSIQSGDHYIVVFYPSILPSLHPLCLGVCYPGHSFSPLPVQPALFPGFLFLLMSAGNTIPFP